MESILRVVKSIKDIVESKNSNRKSMSAKLKGEFEKTFYRTAADKKLRKKYFKHKKTTL